MSEIRAALVDLDGTLVETRAANYQAYASALEEVGIRIDYHDFQETAYGKSWRQFLPPIIAASGSTADPAGIAKRKSLIYPTLLHLTVVNKALVRILRQMKSTCRIALVTTASSANARALLDHHELTSLFDEIITGDDVRNHKPDPEAYLLAASRLGVTANEAVIFEDSVIGVASAKAFRRRRFMLSRLMKKVFGRIFSAYLFSPRIGSRGIAELFRVKRDDGIYEYAGKRRPNTFCISLLGAIT